MVGQTPDAYDLAHQAKLPAPGTASWWRSTEIAAWYSMFDNHVRRIHGEAGLVHGLAIDDDSDVWTVGDPWLKVITSAMDGFDEGCLRQAKDSFEFLNDRPRRGLQPTVRP